MISHELARQLKDAGFPQGPYQPVFDEVRQHPNRAASYAEAFGVSKLDEIAYQPLLHELIEACGNNLLDLKNMGNEWWAYSQLDVPPNGYVPAATIDEAVAKFWLALHEFV